LSRKTEEKVDGYLLTKELSMLGIVNVKTLQIMCPSARKEGGCRPTVEEAVCLRNRHQAFREME